MTLSEVVFCAVGSVVSKACIEVCNYIIRRHSVPYGYMMRNGNKGHIDSWLKCCGYKGFEQGMSMVMLDKIRMLEHF